MLGFLVKKAFFDMWDHFLGVVILNLGFILIITLTPLLAQFLAPITVAGSLASFVVGGALLFLYTGVVSMAARDIANYERPEFRRVVGYLKETWKTSLIHGLIWLGVTIVVVFGFPFYSQVGGWLGLAAIVFLFWAVVIWTLASQFYFPIRAQLDSEPRKIIRKSFVLFFDNTFFAIALGILTLIGFVLSSLTAFLMPGFTALLVLHQVALKLRLLKYDYLEENKEASRKDIPWDALLIDERNRVGKRTFRGMIFPWKE